MQQVQSVPSAAPLPLPFPRILCAVDGSDSAREAVRQAACLAGADATLTVLAIDERVARAVRASGVQAELLVCFGSDPQRAILDAAHDHDLLVLGAHGRYRRAGYLLGSTALAMVRSAPAAVMVARVPPDGAEFPRSILLATDGSPAMGPTVALAGALARRHRARITLLHIDHADAATRHELAEETTALSAATGIEPVTLQLEGHTPARIADVARDVPASLVITGSRLLTGFHALASVSQRTAVAAPCSVLVLRSARYARASWSSASSASAP
jgi:nucleotide-binding universal stress UspA family protein